MDINQSKIILRSYLGKFFVSISSEREALFKKKIKKLDTYYVVGDPVFLRQVGAFYLLAFGKQNYKSIISYDIMETLLGHTEEFGTSFQEIGGPVLIVYHFKRTFVNKRLEDSLNHLIGYRIADGRKTLILTECPLKEVEGAFPDIVISFYKGLGLGDDL